MTEREVLTSRFIDRALRPLFPDGYRDETQVTAQVIVGRSGLRHATCSRSSAHRRR